MKGSNSNRIPYSIGLIIGLMSLILFSLLVVTYGTLSIGFLWFLLGISLVLLGLWGLMR